MPNKKEKSKNADLQKLKILKKVATKEDKLFVANKLNVSPVYVNYVLSGERKNSDIVKLLTKKVKETFIEVQSL